MWMKLLRRVLREDAQGAPYIEENTYIDLAKLDFQADDMQEPSIRMMIRVGEVHRYDDFPKLTNVVYNGDALIIDYTSMEKDELELNRMFKHIKELVRDVNGDAVGLGKGLLIIAPSGVRIARQKLT